MNTTKNTLDDILAEFHHYKTIGDLVFSQLNKESISWQYNNEGYSISLIVKHMTNDILCSLLNLLTEYDEKKSPLSSDFYIKSYTTRFEMLEKWEEAWDCLFTSIERFDTNNFNKSIKINNKTLTLKEIIKNQLSLCAAYIDDIVFLERMLKRHNIIPSLDYNY